MTATAIVKANTSTNIVKGVDHLEKVVFYKLQFTIGRSRIKREDLWPDGVNAVLLYIFFMMVSLVGIFSGC